MSTNPLEYAVAAQEKTLDLLRQSQDTAVEAVQNWAKAVENAAPDRPAVPVLAAMPSPQDLVKNTFDFADQIMGSQRKFAEELIKVTQNVVKTTPVEAPVAK
ncbi:MAG: hypothetical protein H6531_11035 [Actinobacteria bacterium]|nr:hypothetical protein [Thermoleophilia bacterium]MCB9012347.1 hypothetical protein [Actinomycetota bacterium]